MLYVFSIVSGLFLSTVVIAEKHSYEVQRQNYQTQESQSENDLDSDLLEFINRPIFAFNQVVNGVLIDPLATMYKSALPTQIQDGIGNFLNNIVEPITVVNDCLQAEGKSALESFSRLLINTTFGVFGLFDVAKHLGLPGHKTTFNTTMKSWGIPQGPYIVLPILGPASPRFIVGLGLDYLVDPFSYFMIHHHNYGMLYTLTGLWFIRLRAEMLDDIKNFERTSIDFYAAMRSFYIQYMNANRTGGVVTYASPSLKEFMDD